MIRVDPYLSSIELVSSGMARTLAHPSWPSPLRSSGWVCNNADSRRRSLTILRSPDAEDSRIGIGYNDECLPSFAECLGALYQGLAFGAYWWKDSCFRVRREVTRLASLGLYVWSALFVCTLSTFWMFLQSVFGALCVHCTDGSR